MASAQEANQLAEMARADAEPCGGRQELFAAAAAFDHVGGQGPRALRKPDQRHLCR